MPKYQSVTGSDVYFVQSGVAYIATGDGKPLVLNEILNPIPGGIIQVDQNPKYQNIYASWSITANSNLTVPNTTIIPGRYRVWLYSVSGGWSITFNGNGGQPILLGTQQSWDKTCQLRVIDVINAVNTAAGTLIVNIESA